jgi:hypothetical protein
MDAPTHKRRWVRYALIWAALLIVIWWLSAITTMKYGLTYDGPRVIDRWGNLQFVPRMVAIEDPRPPTRQEIVIRGTCGTVLALVGWLAIRSAAILDRNAASARHRKRPSASHGELP